MAVYRVLDVQVPAEPAEELLGSFIDLPKVGDEGDVFVLHVVGWVLGRHSPATAVEVVYQPEPDIVRPGPDRVIRITPIRGDRGDVAAAYPGVPAEIDCHFESLLSVVGLTPEFELRLKAVLEDQTRVPIGSLRVRHEPLRTSFEPTMQPLTLTCLGRTGTTWVMGMLAAHPQIAVYRRFPYESSTAKYWMQMLKVLAEPSNMVQSSHPDTFHNDIWRVGHNPYYDDAIASNPTHNAWFGRSYVERLAAFSQQSIEDWYRTLAETQGQESPLYFAEKHLWPNYIPVLMRELYPRAKEIFLVRDFRDMALSIMAFDAKRGWAGFGRREGTTDEQYLQEVLRPAALSMANSWRTRGSSSHLVRYEDMVLQPRSTLSALLEYLELDASPDLVDSLLEQASMETDQVRRHRTTRDPRESIGRWRRERDDLFREACNAAFADVLPEFGYSEHGYTESGVSESGVGS